MNAVLTLWFAAVAYGVFFLVPPAEGLGYLVRIAFFHIPVAWVAVLAFGQSAWNALRYLQTRQWHYDWRSSSAAGLGLVFCLLATGSGAVFAKLTWGAYWNWDPRQTSIFVLLLIYGSYMALRSSLEDAELRARVSAVYTLLAVITVPFLVFILPRFYYSLHPEPLLNSGGQLQMEATMLVVLLAALAGFTAVYWRILHWRVGRKAQQWREREMTLLRQEVGP